MGARPAEDGGVQGRTPLHPPPGPAFSVYVFAEPSSWQAMETGAKTFFAARSDIMAKGLKWGRHSDNLLNEIAVQ
jgi:hypothetical protein